MNTQELEWVEKAGIENLRSRLATGDALLAQANMLLSILLVGIGGALTYGVNLSSKAAASPLVGGMVVVIVWLVSVAGLLAFNCLFTRKTQLLYNEPRNLHQPQLGITFEQLRGFELENIQARIELTKARNAQVALWLDRCRGAAIATPIPFIVGAVVAAYR